MEFGKNFQIDTSDIQKKFEHFKKTLNDPSGVFTKTMSDMQRRAPGKVADAVRGVYSIKKSDIMPSKIKRDLKQAGMIKVRGRTVEDLAIYYEGRVLTPLHFGMTPKVPPKKGKKYSIKVKIKKQRKTVSYPTKEGKFPFIAPARKSSLRFIPWLRDADGEITPMKTLSLPQMVDNETARNIMNQTLGELLHERFNHHMKRCLKESVKSP